jgi:multiple sugar transport system permease protein
MPKQHQRFFFLAPLVLVLLPFLIGPTLFGFIASFTNYGPGQTHPHFVGVANYASVLRDKQFHAAASNILWFTLVTVSAELFFGFALAYLLRRPFRGQGLIRVVLLLPWLISPIAHGVMWHFLTNADIGLLNYWVAWLNLGRPPSPLGLPQTALVGTMLLDIWRKVPLASFLLLPGLLTIPADQWNEATLEGWSVLNGMRYIALPWLRPLLLTVAMLLIGDALGTFETMLMLTGGGPGARTVTPGLYSYTYAFKAHNWPIGVAAAWLVVAAVLLIGIFYVVLMRREVRDGR